MNKIKDYRFLVPSTDETYDWMNEHFHDCFESSDGSPFCHIEEGFLVDYKQCKEIPDFILSNCLIFKLDERFETKENFLTEFWDGDTEDSDFTL